MGCFLIVCISPMFLCFCTIGSPWVFVVWTSTLSSRGSLLCHSSAVRALCVFEKVSVVMLQQRAEQQTAQRFFSSSSSSPPGFWLWLPLPSAELCPVTVVRLLHDIPSLDPWWAKGHQRRTASGFKSDLFFCSRTLRIVSSTTSNYWITPQ